MKQKKIGGKFTVYWTFGKYDGIGILETPDDEAAMEFGLRVGSLGDVRTTTLKTFTKEEIGRVISKLSCVSHGILLSHMEWLLFPSSTKCSR